MRDQTKSRNGLGGSRLSSKITRFCAVALAMGALGVAALAQAQTDAAKPAKQATQQKAAADPEEKTIGGYAVHQDIELGGRIVTNKTGSDPMWATMVNQGTGMRVLNHMLQMHSLNPSKTPFFDSLTSESFGYGGDPYDVSRLSLSKGRWYDFSGSFRRDRNYFDYNLLTNSLLTTYTAAAPVLVSEPDTLHLFNTVRRNSDAQLTLLPLSFISFRAGANHATHEGPTYSSVHAGGDTQVLEWFRNSTDDVSGGVDLKPFKRTTLSYDQFFVMNRVDNTFQLAGANYKLSDGTPVSLGFDVLGGNTTCGSAAVAPSSSNPKGTPNTKGPEIANGIVWPYCSATTAQSETAPIRTSFPVEQLRLTSRYWDRLYVNGRLLYSGGTSYVNRFSQTFTGWLARTYARQEVVTGGEPNGRLANNTRANLNGDFSADLELAKFLSVSDTFSEWNLRTEGNAILNTQTWTGTPGTYAGGTASATSILTPLSTITPSSTSTAINGFLDQKYDSNTILANATVLPQFKVDGGWRFVKRHIVDAGDDLTWHQNWLLLGGVIQPSRAVRLNLNYEGMNSKSADPATTPSNTYTREAPDKIEHFRARATVIPAKWINFAVTGNAYSAKNDDPLVNHFEHNHDFSFATQVIPTEDFSFDFNFARDDAFSETDLCYVFTPNANAALPAGAVNRAGTCANTTLATATPDYLGYGTYDAPDTYFAAAVNFAPSKYLKFRGGARVNSSGGRAELLNPLMVPGALDSKVISPFADLQVNVARQWAWHGNWEHHGYDESGGAGPAARTFHGDVLTLGVKHSF